MKISKHKKILILLISVLIITFSIFLWKEFKGKIFPRNWGVVEPELLYRSGRLDPFLMETTFKTYKIKSIINLCGKDENSIPEDTVAKKLNIKIYYHSMSGNGIVEPEKYVSVIEDIVREREKREAVLVHCASGAQRTGGVIAVYQLLIQNAAPTDVHAEMMKYGWKPGKNKKLLSFLNENMDFFARELYKDGFIASVPSPIPVIAAE